MNPVIVFSVCAAACFLGALLVWREERRTKQAVPRMVITTGVVRELESLMVDRSAANRRSATLVQVDFSVGGKSYCCRTLRLFAGNRHIGDVGKKFDFPPGQQVGVYYDPEDPRRSALILDKPRYNMTFTAVVVGVIFLVMAVVKSVQS